MTETCPKTLNKLWTGTVCSTLNGDNIMRTHFCTTALYFTSSCVLLALCSKQSLRRRLWPSPTSPASPFSCGAVGTVLGCTTFEIVDSAQERQAVFDSSFLKHAGRTRKYWYIMFHEFFHNEQGLQQLSRSVIQSFLIATLAWLSWAHIFCSKGITK